MRKRCFWCHHKPAQRVETGNGDLLPGYRGRFSTLEEQMAPFRLVELVSQRPDLTGLPAVGARLAAAVTEGV